MQQTIPEFERVSLIPFPAPISATFPAHSVNVKEILEVNLHSLLLFMQSVNWNILKLENMSQVFIRKGILVKFRVKREKKISD